MSAIEPTAALLGATQRTSSSANNGHYRIAEIGIPKWGKASRDWRNALVGWCRKNDFGEGSMKFPRRKFLHLAAGAGALPAFSPLARAQAYPTRAVRIVVSVAAGGGADIVARLIAQWLSERLGRPFIVENRPGGGGNIATEAVVRAPADGHTLLMVITPNAVNTTLYENLTFVFLRDIAPVAGLTLDPTVMAVNPALPAATVPAFIAYAKVNPGKINMGSGGIGTVQHVAGELFKMMTGVNMVHVPYRGEGAALPDLLGGQLQVMFPTITASISYIKAGRLRPLAVTSATRAEALPEVPTVGEFIAGYEAINFRGIGAPKNTPAAIIDRLNREINSGLADPAVKARIADLGAVTIAGSPAAFGKFLADETEKWAKVVRFAGIKPE
jgi:tripartite-type tricarboxylate transporter receptor subunit TctC